MEDSDFPSCSFSANRASHPSRVTGGLGGCPVYARVCLRSECVRDAPACLRRVTWMWRARDRRCAPVHRRARVCASVQVRARSWLNTSRSQSVPRTRSRALHPEVFASRATQLTETKQRGTTRRLTARRWLSAAPWRPQPPAPPTEARRAGSPLPGHPPAPPRQPRAPPGLA